MINELIVLGLFRKYQFVLGFCVQQLCSEARLLFYEAWGTASMPPQDPDLDHIIPLGRTFWTGIFGTMSFPQTFVAPAPWGIKEVYQEEVDWYAPCLSEYPH